MGFPYLGLLVILVMLLKPFSCQQQQQPNTDAYFLSLFFQKMNLTTTTTTRRSFDKQNVCSWNGVFCEDKQVYVVGFVASGLGLTGLIPDTTIGKLTKLQFLDLSNNSITGLPSDLWSLTSLKTLNLSHNLISGSLPSNIGNFGHLQTLDLSSNNFSFQVPESIGTLLGMETLILSQNAFEGEVPMSIVNCKSLVTVDFSSNRLYGKLPRGFGAAFPMLKKLSIGGNNIQGKDLDFVDFKSITYLNISDNYFQGSVMGVFRESLEVMDLSKNHFSGHLSQVQFNWSHLVYLDLSENELGGSISLDLSSAHNLKHLNLACNRFSTQEFPIIIQTLWGLEYLNLSRTSLTSHIPVEISRLRSLNTLDVSGNHLTGRIPVISTKSLKIIDVSGNNLTGGIPVSLLENLPRMARFNFSYNNLTLCASEISSQMLKTAFIGSQSSCPIAANPQLFKRKSTSGHTHIGLRLVLALTFSLVCLLALLLLCTVALCRSRKKRTNWAVKQNSNSYREDQENISGPFAFQTDSITWVADVKLATTVPVRIFEKPLLNFTFADLLSATSHFERGTLLAEGRFGPVYRGFLPGGIHIAVKVLVNGSSTMTDQEVATELEYLGQIKHPNLVPLVGYCLAGDQRIAIYDFMENGNLHNLLYDLPLGVQKTEDWSNDTWEEEEDGDTDTGIQNVGSERFLTTWRFRHKIALGTARALAFLHHGCSPPIIHRDVKASSVYLDINLEPRLSDFGLGNFFGNVSTSDIIASPGYTPPEFSEVPNGCSSPVTPTQKSDVYGFGVILFELLTGKKPIGDDYPDEKGRNSATTLVGWVRGLVRTNLGSRAIDPKLRGTGPEAQMEEALKLGYLCTADLPSKRPSMQQIVGLLKDIEPTSNKRGSSSTSLTC